MKTYVIEREITGAGALTQDQLKEISQVSCTVLQEIGPTIKWVHSYVTGNKVFCVYQATNKEMILKHGEKSGIPVHAIHELAAKIGPKTA